MAGTKINILVDDEVVERLYMEPGDEFHAEVHTNDYTIRIPEEDS